MDKKNDFIVSSFLFPQTREIFKTKILDISSSTVSEEKCFSIFETFDKTEIPITVGLLLSLADGIKSTFVRCSSAVRAENSLFNFCIYLRLWVRYWADVPAGRALNASAAASPVRKVQYRNVFIHQGLTKLFIQLCKIFSSLFSVDSFRQTFFGCHFLLKISLFRRTKK